MSIEATSGGYSPDTVYGNLTAPFLYDEGKPGAFLIHINAHTPYDEPAESKAVSQSDYRQLVQNEKLFHIEDFVSIQSIGLQSEKFSQGLVERATYEPYSAKTVSSFSLSSLSKSDMVNNALKLGYSPNMALTVANAQRAYQNQPTNVAANVVDVLGNAEFN